MKYDTQVFGKSSCLDAQLKCTHCWHAGERVPDVTASIGKQLSCLIDIGFCRPYLVAECVLAVIGIPFIGCKAIMLRHKLVSKWGSLLLCSGIFSVIHVFAALNIHLFARMRQNVRRTATTVVSFLIGPWYTVHVNCGAPTISPHQSLNRCIAHLDLSCTVLFWRL